MPRKYLLILTGVAFFFFFILFSYLVHENLFTAADFNTTVRMQDNIPRRFDRVFSLLSDIGKFEVSFVVLILIFALSRKIWAGLGGLILFTGFHLIELFGKFFVDHPPPPEFMLRTERIMNFPQFHVRSEFSYPSGHAGRSLFLSVILITLIMNSKKLRNTSKAALVLVITCYNGVMLVSRIYLGEHWTTDVVGGAILGAGLGLISGGLLSFSLKKSIPKPKDVKSDENA